MPTQESGALGSPVNLSQDSRCVFMTGAPACGSMVAGAGMLAEGSHPEQHAN